MRNQYNTIHINCQICGNNNYKDIHKASIDTGLVFGRISVINVICIVCGFIYQNPRLTEESLNFYYTHSNLSSGSTFRSSVPGSRQATLIKERTRYIKESLKYGTGGEKGLMVDVGCSNGSLLASFDLEGWEKIGIEPSLTAAQTADMAGVKVINDFFENVSLTSSTVDIVSLFSFLEHAQDVNIIMKKCKMLLKPGGILIVEVPDSHKPTLQVSDFFSLEHLSNFTMHTLKKFLAIHGFEVIGSDKNITLPNLRVCAVRNEDVKIEPLNDSRQIIRTIGIVEKYNVERRKFILSFKERLDSLVESWERKNYSVGVFGAGMHSHLLFDCSSLSSIVKCIFDNDPEKQGKKFLHWEILNPSMIEEIPLDVIVISSRDFQNEIYSQIFPVCDAEGISVVRLY